MKKPSEQVIAQDCILSERIRSLHHVSCFSFFKDIPKRVEPSASESPSRHAQTTASRGTSGRCCPTAARGSKSECRSVSPDRNKPEILIAGSELPVHVRPSALGAAQAMSAEIMQHQQEVLFTQSKSHILNYELRLSF